MLRQLSVLVTLAAIAGPQIAAADGWSASGQITSMMYGGDGSLHVWANMARTDLAGCGGDRYIFALNNAHLKEIYASILTAYATEKAVRLAISSSTCTGGNPAALVVELD